MFGESVSQRLEELRRWLSALTSAGDCAAAAATAVRSLLPADSVTVVYGSPEHPSVIVDPAVEGEDRPLIVWGAEGFACGGATVALPLSCADLSLARLPAELTAALARALCRSVLIVGIYRDGVPIGWIMCSFRTRYHRWEAGEVQSVQRVADILAGHLERSRRLPAGSARSAPTEARVHERFQEMMLRYGRLMEAGNLLLIRTDAALVVTDVLGNTERLLGIAAGELIAQRGVWRHFLAPADLRRLARTLAARNEGAVSEELAVVHRQSGEERWFLVTGIPLLGGDGRFAGWEALALDITEKRRTREKILAQSRRIEALYEVSRALQVNMDPASVTLKGLRAIVAATGSHCGFGALYDRGADELEIVAAEGLSPRYLDAFGRIINGQTLVRLAVTTRTGLLVPDLQADPRAAVDLARMEGLRATIVMPLVSDEETVGAIVLFSRRPDQYSEDDFDLVSAAARQIALAVGQADFYMTERRQADSAAALYRLSHELTKHMTPADVGMHAFPIIQEEVACRRLWLGVVNDQGTHIAGQAGMGPGVRRGVIEAQLEIASAGPLLQRALKSGEPVVFRLGEAEVCGGLERVLSRLEVTTTIIVPLMSVSQVVGLLVLEPQVPAASLNPRKLTLITNMATEIATVILARRFDAKMAEADKMRMAGVLASGVAHNFNNMLQAVMGQASLIEMQSPRDGPVATSARMIVEAAGKGATLIRQLLSFSMQGGVVRQNLSPNRIITEAQELYKSVLGSAIALDVRLDPGCGEVFADFGQLQQVLTNLLVNAREAMVGREESQVRITSHQVRLRPGEVDPELAPGLYVRIDVEDNGPGMDARQQAHCFEPFYTTKNVDSRTGIGLQGTGLGLSSAYSILKQHEGLITVRSQPGRGAVFSLYLPVAAPVAAAVAAAITPPAETVSAPPAVERAALLFGLDEVVLPAVRSTIESLGMGTLVASSEAEMMSLLGESGRGIQLLVLDVERLGERCPEFVGQVRKIRSRLKVLCSTDDRVRWGREFKGQAGVEVVEKPLGVWTLSFHVRRALKNPAPVPLAAQIEIERDPPLKGGEALEGAEGEVLVKSERS